ncbi:MAG: hypothetical protein A2W90_15180 [Bacteroidetes bacterium GWF2_42_66]|nr:MAG: hypothetical protein A2W92_23610 [Bacteroidetes bacterium GWA2_42_15]OFX96841.1 MAG: hypothetical protein A2W89_19675 [Bacteroidetes bacterium GWE2_42_39]OFY46836.1 MAG: hypothetical protein A2W90_15180 [Bacteroidetes bacterium GWF2_42_66]HBL75123.1 hypothetical protein [Prolixibacteraceae bacterium]HCR89194.1 hypothetical protein [Prolixibacteraceae bacterium]
MRINSLLIERIKLLKKNLSQNEIKLFPCLNMENQKIIEELTIENVGTLTEAQIDKVMCRIEQESDKEKRSQFMKIIETAFEFRTISAKSRDLKADLAFFGYRFFPVKNNKFFIRGIRRKTTKWN